MEVGLLILRVSVGLLVAAHGCQKLFGWFGAGHREPARVEFEGYGYRPAWVFAVAAGAIELLSGLMLAVGLGTTLAAALIAGTSFQAVVAVKLRNGPWIQDGGYEYLLVLAAAALALAFTGPGSWALDPVVGLDLSGVAWGIAATAAAALAVGLPRRIPFIGDQADSTDTGPARPPHLKGAP